jgi:hypothetical protein
MAQPTPKKSHATNTQSSVIAKRLTASEIDKRPVANSTSGFSKATDFVSNVGENPLGKVVGKVAGWVAAQQGVLPKDRSPHAIEAWQSGKVFSKVSPEA